MLKRLQFRPGVDRETTRYTSEGGWYDCDKVRFRSGSPEKIGGWEQVSNVNTFQGTARSLWPWATFAYATYLGVGTNLKYYIMYGGAYNDITPLRSTATLTNPFTATNGSAIITVADVAHGCEDGDFVTFSGATGLGGNITATVLNAEYQVTVIDDDSYTITATATANATDAAGSPGGGTVIRKTAFVLQKDIKRSIKVHASPLQKYRYKDSQQHRQQQWQQNQVHQGTPFQRLYRRPL